MIAIKSVIIAILIISSYTGYAQDSSVRTTEINKANSVNNIYCCPMHPDVKSEILGKWTKCKMDLVKSKKEKMKNEIMKMYQCPMHSNEVSNRSGKCKKCKMDMKEKMENKN